MPTKYQYSCFYCGEGFKAKDWKADQKNIIDCYGNKTYQEETTRIYYEHMPHIGGTGICSKCCLPILDAEMPIRAMNALAKKLGGEVIEIKKI